MLVNCPRCGLPHEWDANPWRPFCSERCRLIDLGDWLCERHVIAGDEEGQEENKSGPQPT